MAWLEIIKGIFTWIWSNKNTALIIALIAVVAFLTWKNNKLKIKNDTLTIEKGQLPDNIEFIADLKGTKFQVTYRDSKGTVVHKEYYVPKEGGLTFTKFIDLKKYDANSGFSDKSLTPPPPVLTNPIAKFISDVFGPKKADGSTDIKIAWYGFCFRPGIAGMYDGGLDPKNPVSIAIDAKLFYMNRYSAGLGSSWQYPYVFVSRHIDDLVPFITVENLELMIGYGKPYDNFSNSVFTIGGRSNF